MTDHEGAHHDETPGLGGFWTARSFITWLALLLIAAFLLLSEHRAHVLGAALWLLLLACPLLHLFMHGRHGGHGSHSNSSRGVARDSNGPRGGKP